MQLLDYRNETGEFRITIKPDIVHIKYKIDKIQINVAYNFTDKILHSLIKKETVFLKADNFMYHYVKDKKELHIGNHTLTESKEIELINISLKLLLSLL